MPYLRDNKSSTILGVALSVTAPFGEYYGDKLINLGQNRYIIRPQVGVLHIQGKWSYELTGSVFIYTDNTEFYGSKHREQKPLYALQGHVIHSLDADKWISASTGYGIGGESTIDHVNKNDQKHTLLSAVSFGMPIRKDQSIKVAYMYQKSYSSLGKNAKSLAFLELKRF
jgi:hypothetical protein